MQLLTTKHQPTSDTRRSTFDHWETPEINLKPKDTIYKIYFVEFADNIGQDLDGDAMCSNNLKASNNK